MNSPAFIVSKIAQRLTYNLGRVQKEAGLRKYICSDKHIAYQSLWMWTNFSVQLELDRMGSSMTHDIAYLQESSRHRQAMPLYDCIP